MLAASARCTVKILCVTATCWGFRSSRTSVQHSKTFSRRQLEPRPRQTFGVHRVRSFLHDIQCTTGGSPIRVQYYKYNCTWTCSSILRLMVIYELKIDILLNISGKTNLERSTHKTKPLTISTQTQPVCYWSRSFYISSHAPHASHATLHWQWCNIGPRQFIKFHEGLHWRRSCDTQFNIDDKQRCWPSNRIITSNFAIVSRHKH